jgi:hypothetical protein
MKRAVVLLTALLTVFCAAGKSRAETALGAVFGYPGNAGLSARFADKPIALAWSSDLIHGTADLWMIKKPLDVGEGRLSWYFGPGGDIGVPLDDDEEFFLAARAPLGVQFMLSPKVETFGEFAPGVQLVDETDFYWAASVGVRFVLGGKAAAKEPAKSP